MKEKDDKPTLTEKVLTVFKYPASVAAGAYFVHRNSRNALYDTLKNNSNVFDVARDTLKTDIAKEQSAENLKGKIRPKSIKYNGSVGDVLKSKGWRHAIDYISELHPNQQIDALIAGGTAATVTFTVASTLLQTDLIKRVIHSQNTNDTQTPAR